MSLKSFQWTRKWQKRKKMLWQSWKTAIDSQPWVAEASFAFKKSVKEFKTTFRKIFFFFFFLLPNKPEKCFTAKRQRKKKAFQFSLFDFNSEIKDETFRSSQRRKFSLTTLEQDWINGKEFPWEFLVLSCSSRTQQWLWRLWEQKVAVWESKKKKKMFALYKRRKLCCKKWNCYHFAEHAANGGTTGDDFC